MIDSSKIQIREGDRSTPRIPHKHPIVLVLDHLRSAYNVGNIYRLAEIFQVEKIITCGYTPTPPHPKLKKTARGCEELVHSQHIETPEEALAFLQSEGYSIVGVETVPDAPIVWNATFHYPLALVFGNEALGISSHVFPFISHWVRLPVFGCKNSLNVSNSVAIVLDRAVEGYYRGHSLPKNV